MITNSGSLCTAPVGARILSLAEARARRGLSPVEPASRLDGQSDHLWRVGDECLVPDLNGSGRYVPAIITGIDREIYGGNVRVCPLGGYGAAHICHPLSALRLRGEVRSHGRPGGDAA
ncbi:hypothetical protein FHS85_002892 [Rhodoligotrophos appendicifer]|uniref:hypothetical protein n=1 Tax=Rhodoligotrophos appendicifer TaxID=987056 RepID=UPI0011861458|nr:hypothetical protein [Rhodoligotrophos appendicifer]